MDAAPKTTPTMRLSKEGLFAVLLSVSIMSVLVSNIITSKQALFFGFSVTCGTFLIPVSYIANDVLAEVYGFSKARMVVVLSFMCNLLAVVFFELTLIAPSSPAFSAQASFEAVLGSTPRILAASFLAFVCGSLLNAKVMDRMHARDGESRLAFRCILSTILGETLDMTLFGCIAFVGVLEPFVLVEVIVTAVIVKVAIECVCYPLFTWRVIRFAKRLPNERGT